VRALRVGVVGVGHLGKEHARIYRSLRDVELVGVVDVDEARARTVARRCRAEWSTKLDLLLGRAEAVSVVVPTAAHHDVAMRLIERGISVLIEKPMTFDVAQAEALVAAADAHEVKLQVGHVERFNPAFAAVARRRLRPVFIEAHRLSPFRFRSADVGVVFDLMIHDLDIIHVLMGSEVSRIDAVGVPVISPHEDIANARVVFANGCVANLTASRVSLKTLRKIRLFAPSCYVTIDTQQGEVQLYRKKEGFDEVARRLRDATGLAALRGMRKLVYDDLVEVERVAAKGDEPLRAELASFVAAVRDDRTPEVTGEDGLRAVRVATRVVEEVRRNLEAIGYDPQTGALVG